MLYQPNAQVDLAAIARPGNAVSNMLYLPLSGATTTVLRGDAAGGTVLPAVNGQFYGLAVLGDKLAYSVADLSATPLTSEFGSAWRGRDTGDRRLHADCDHCADGAPGL